MTSQPQNINLKDDIEKLVGLLKDLEKDPHCPVDKDKIEATVHALEGDFFHTVRNVYETIYNNLCSSFQSDPRAKAKAVSQATVAAFAAASDNAHPRVVRLRKQNNGFGFNVMGGKEQKSQIIVSKIIPGGAAFLQGDLLQGDQLLSVNGISVENEYHDRAVDVLKECAPGEEVCLIVRYMPNILREMESKFSTNQ